MMITIELITDGQPLKALTLHQPWAQLIAAGHKRIETRSWQTEYRGLLAIHAAQPQPGETELFTTMAEDGIDLHGLTPFNVRHGAIIAIATLADVVPIDDLLASDSGGRYTSELPYGDFTPGRYAWLLEDIQALSEPYPIAGHQGLWNVTIESVEVPLIDGIPMDMKKDDTDA